MKFVYPALITKTENGYHAEFPDLTMCCADGKDLDDTLRRARDAMYDWIDLELSEEEPELPAVSETTDVAAADGAFVRNIMINYRFHVGWDE